MAHRQIALVQINKRKPPIHAKSADVGVLHQLVAVVAVGFIEDYHDAAYL